MVHFNGPQQKPRKGKTKIISKQCEQCNNWFASAVEKAKCSLCTRVFESMLERNSRINEEERETQYTDWG